MLLHGHGRLQLRKRHRLKEIEMNEKQARDAMNSKATVRAEAWHSKARGTIIEVDGDEAAVKDEGGVVLYYQLDEIQAA